MTGSLPAERVLSIRRKLVIVTVLGLVMAITLLFGFHEYSSSTSRPPSAGEATGSVLVFVNDPQATVKADITFEITGRDPDFTGGTVEVNLALAFLPDDAQLRRPLEWLVMMSGSATPLSDVETFEVKSQQGTVPDLLNSGKDQRGQVCAPPIQDLPDGTCSPEMEGPWASGPWTAVTGTSTGETTGRRTDLPSTLDPNVVLSWRTEDPWDITVNGRTAGAIPAFGTVNQGVQAFTTILAEDLAKQRHQNRFHPMDAFTYLDSRVFQPLGKPARWTRPKQADLNAWVVHSTAARAGVYYQVDAFPESESTRRRNTTHWTAQDYFAGGSWAGAAESLRDEVNNSLFASGVWLGLGGGAAFAFLEKLLELVFVLRRSDFRRKPKPIPEEASVKD